MRSPIPSASAGSGFQLTGVIEGWTEGLQLMVEGETRRFWIPQKLAYRGQPGYPAGGLSLAMGARAGDIGRDEVTIESEAQFLGYSQPRSLFSVNPQLSLFKNVVRLGALPSRRSRM